MPTRGRIAVGVALMLGVAGDAGADRALDFLRAHKPGVKWRGRVVHAEVTGDGVPDATAVGLTRDTVIVSTIVGPILLGSEIVSTSWPISADGMPTECLDGLELSAEPIHLPLGEDDGGVRPAGQVGLRLELASPCGTFHLYWNAKGRWFSWWREPR
jgi:hypothetical protein